MTFLLARKPTQITSHRGVEQMNKQLNHFEALGSPEPAKTLEPIHVGFICSDNQFPNCGQFAQILLRPCRPKGLIPWFSFSESRMEDDSGVFQ